MKKKINKIKIVRKINDSKIVTFFPFYYYKIFKNFLLDYSPYNMKFLDFS